jgi:PPP family 3-phenylpropionic acid transporter
MLARFCVHYFVLFAVIATLNPYLQLFLRAKGFSDSEVGLLQGLVGLAGVAGPMVVCYLADRFGKRRALLVACLAVFAALMLLLNATGLPLNATGTLAVTAALAAGVGFVSRTPIPLTDTLATHELPDPANQYGKVRVWGSLGYVATLLGIRALGLVDEQSSTSMAVAMAAPAVLAIFSTLPLPDRHRAADAHTAASAPGGGFDWVFWLFLLAAGLHQVGITAHYSFFSLYLHDVLGMGQGGWVWAIGSIFELPMIFFAGRILRALGLGWAMIAAMAAVSLRLTIYALLPVLTAVLAAQALHALTFGLYHVASIEFLRRKAPPGRRGLAMALYMSLVIGLPGLIGSSVGGTLIEHWGYRTLYLSYAIPPMLGVICLAAAAGRLPRLDRA